MNIHDVLDKAREIPALAGRPSIGRLYAFLQGFLLANENKDDIQFLARFGTFVHRRYKITSVQSWASIIEFFSTSEAQEMALFWKLMDEFLAQQEEKKQRPKKAQA